MIGFVTNTATSAIVLDGIREAQLSRGSAHYWTTGAMPIHTGDDEGQMFIPASDAILSTPLRVGVTPRDFPEFDQLVTVLGGLDARVDIDPDVLINPDISEL
tara:strand:+ start:919 stop:1224 length:306 start_codon:yes stop_codon:yes gene_type:complete